MLPPVPCNEMANPRRSGKLRDSAEMAVGCQNVMAMPAMAAAAMAVGKLCAAPTKRREYPRDDDGEAKNHRPVSLEPVRDESRRYVDHTPCKVSERGERADACVAESQTCLQLRQQHQKGAVHHVLDRMAATVITASSTRPMLPPLRVWLRGQTNS